MDSTVHWALPGDAAGVARVHVAAWQRAYTGLVDQPILDGLQVDDRTRTWREWITASLAGEPTDTGLADAGEKHPHRLLVAELDGRILGWATVGPGRDDHSTQFGELAGLYVHPDHWSCGVGRALLDRAQQELTAAGWLEAYLWVLQGNKRAIDFYQRRGWMPDGATKAEELSPGAVLREERYWRTLP